MTDYAKLDAGLAMALRTYESEFSSGATSEGITVRIAHTGDLTAIEAAGFELHEAGEGQAFGVVLFKDLPALTALDQVEWISSGRARTKKLNKAVQDMGVRASNAGLTDGLWHAEPATGNNFTSAADASGAGVIVAVLDTGIDYTHPMFMSQLTPSKQTRILRIWDLGLVPTAAAECPDASLLGSAERYGVEYDGNEIDAALNGGPPLRHRDCDGHGTHTAGIAAGGNRFAGGADATRMGVAPQADIIAVKLLDLPDTIHFFTGAPNREVGPDTQFRDAVLYCLRTARSLSRPIVLNMSFGFDGKPGDGLDVEAELIDEMMDPAHAPDALHFPRGAVIVKSSGNEGDASDRAVARIVVPAGGEVTVPLVMRDTRGPDHTSLVNCTRTLFSPGIGVDFWYRRANPFTAVSFAVRLPDRAAFTSAMTVGGNFEETFGIRVGPPRVLVNVPDGPGVHTVIARHGGEPSVNHPSGGTVRRHNFSLNVFPRTSATTSMYLTGSYEVKIAGPPGTELFLMCHGQGWAPSSAVLFQIATTMRDGTAIDSTAIQITSEFSMPDPLGRHALTIAAYDDRNRVTADPSYRAIAAFSSRGPLRDFSNPASPVPVIAAKPDIAAPGVSIDSAQSRDSDPPPPLWSRPSWEAGNRFIKHDGTSMAAPMVAGMVALMLDKRPDLTTAQVRGLLSAAARPAVSPSAAPASTRAYGAGLVNGKAAHDATP